MKIRGVLVCGAGTMGTWISAEIHAAGHDTWLADPGQEALGRAKNQHQAACRETLARGATPRRPNNAPEAPEAPIQYVRSVAEALRSDAARIDLVIEAIPENPDLKQELFQALDELTRPGTVLTSNTSILDPTTFITSVRDRSRFACFHFNLPRTCVEISPVNKTATATLDRLAAFALGIGEIPIRLNLASPGHVLGILGGRWTDAALDLLTSDVTGVHAIDRAWMICSGMKTGPFGLVDLVGLDTSLAIRKLRLAADPDNQKLKSGIAILERMVKEGRLGMKSGQGFYSYPEPAYQQPDFLRGDTPSDAGTSDDDQN